MLERSNVIPAIMQGEKKAKENREDPYDWMVDAFPRIYIKEGKKETVSMSLQD